MRLSVPYIWVRHEQLNLVSHPISYSSITTTVIYMFSHFTHVAPIATHSSHQRCVNNSFLISPEFNSRFFFLKIRFRMTATWMFNPKQYNSWASILHYVRDMCECLAFQHAIILKVFLTSNSKEGIRREPHSLGLFSRYAVCIIKGQSNLLKTGFFLKSNGQTVFPWGSKRSLLYRNMELWDKTQCSIR